MANGMLVLSRRFGESIQIGDVLVQVVGIKRGNVRIGIVADPSIPIVRTEIIGRLKMSDLIKTADEVGSVPSANGVLGACEGEVTT